MNGFDGRIKHASKFEEKLFSRLEKLGFLVARNGTEHTHPDFVSRLLLSTDQTSLAIRFQPDAVACIGKTPRSFYVEAKNAVTVERTAWEQYTKLVNNGNMLVIVFRKLSWGWNFFDSIGLIRGEDTVSQYPKHKRFPVVDHWITARGSERWEEIKHTVTRASFTPYRYVMPSTLLPFKYFTRDLINAILVGSNP